MSKLCSFSSFLHIPNRETLAVPALSHRRRLSSFSCSARSSRKKPKSSIELRTEIREFLITAGLPNNHLPSLKDFTDHDRTDLANIVRRRGYKFIQEVLANETANTDSHSSKNLKTVNGSIDALNGQKRHVNGNSVAPFLHSNRSMTIKESCSSTSSVDEKVAKFILTGELDSFKDDDFDLLDGSKSTEASSPQKKSSFDGSVVTYDDGIAEERTNKVSSSSPPQQQTTKLVDQIEVDNLKLMLLQKENELRNLKEQIQKEKDALSSLQMKAETEIKMAQTLVSEKDAELIAAEESLSGLVEVKVEYNGTGDVVELAGSFNGWQHRIEMEPEEQSKTTLMKSGGWSASLWLYPGVYEIKFVIDGEWIVDPDKEMVYSDHICNNVLRVS